MGEVRVSSQQATVDRCNRKGYLTDMIKSFTDKGLERFFYSGSKRGINPEHTNRLLNAK